MDTGLNTKRITIFLAFAFGIPWVAALVIYLSGMLTANPAQAGALANYFFIFTPWLGNIAARLITKEGWGNLMLRPNFKRGWRFYLAAWLLPFLAALVGGAAFYLLFSQSFDPNLGVLRKMVANTASAAADPWMVLLSMSLSILIISTPINMVVSMGEEFGWRAYLLPKLVERFGGGERKAALLTGLIHGVWHWPLILMTASLVPGFSLLSPVVYLVLTCAMSVLLSWCTLRSGSVWPAALGHGAVNAASGLPGYLLKGPALQLIGPDPTGLIGGIGYTLLALVLLLSRKAFAAGKQARSEWAEANPVAG